LAYKICHWIQVTRSEGQKVLVSLEKELKNGHRRDISRSRVINAKHSKSTPSRQEGAEGPKTLGF
jgi:predicted Fe-S protein YdhL (DUF1289 family)